MGDKALGLWGVPPHDVPSRKAISGLPSGVANARQTVDWTRCSRPLYRLGDVYQLTRNYPM